MRDSRAESIKEPSVEQQANSIENPTFLLLSRLRDPVIFDQLVEMYRSFYVEKGEKDNENLRKRITEVLERRIEVVSKNTPISFDVKDSIKMRSGGTTDWDLLASGENIDREIVELSMPVGTTDPERKTQVQSILEAHEKGHVLRLFDHEYFTEHFSLGFDRDAMAVDITKLRKMHKESGDSLLFDDDERLIAIMKEYIFSGPEVVERMSQLKNYFGMKGEESFVQEHLEYARSHYVEDTGADNGMTEFLSAITPDTEEDFLKLINSSGI